MPSHFAILLVATVLDRLIGDPEALWRRVPHPVVLIGRVIDALDVGLNRPELGQRRRRLNGFLAAALLSIGALAVGAFLHEIFDGLGPLGAVLEIVLIAIFLAQKSLIDHVERVACALRSEGVAGGRRAVAMIVGRDTEALDEAGICRAAIESLAENASDGVVAPWLFYLLFGLPGLFLYKAVNTADSMIGHRNERHRAFGFASAKLDDVLNWPAARLTALLLALAAARTGGWSAFHRSWNTARRDAPSHRSPNAGWPEAAMAAALGLSLGGPRRYGELVVDAPALNEGGRRAATHKDIRAALALFRIVSNMLIAAAAALTLAALAS